MKHNRNGNGNGALDVVDTAATNNCALSNQNSHQYFDPSFSQGSETTGPTFFTRLTLQHCLREDVAREGGEVLVSMNTPQDPNSHEERSTNDDGVIDLCSQNNTQSNEKTEVISNKMADKIQKATSQPCDTCGSTKDCEEDVDNPGEYYCKSCWESYASELSQHSSQEDNSQEEEEMAQQQQSPVPADNYYGPAGGDIALNLGNNPTNGNAHNESSPSTSQFMTPRGLSFNTQAESSQEELSFTAQTQPLISQPQTQGLSVASSQPLASQADPTEEALPEKAQCSVDGADEEKGDGPSEMKSLLVDNDNEVAMIEGGQEAKESTQIEVLQKAQISVEDALEEMKGDDYSEMKSFLIDNKEAMTSGFEGNKEATGKSGDSADGNDSVGGDKCGVHKKNVNNVAIGEEEMGKSGNYVNGDESDVDEKSENEETDAIDIEQMNVGKDDLDNANEKNNHPIDDNSNGLDDEKNNVPAESSAKSPSGVDMNRQAEQLDGMPKAEGGSKQRSLLFGSMSMGGDESQSESVNPIIEGGKQVDDTKKKMEVEISKKDVVDLNSQDDASSDEEEVASIGKIQSEMILKDVIALASNAKDDANSDEEEVASIGTQEGFLIESKENNDSGGMGTTFGLLTQAADDDDSDLDDDDDENTSNATPMKEADGGKESGQTVSFANDPVIADQAPVIEAVTTTTNSQNSKHMSLSGLTEPTQPENMLPSDKLPSFGAVNQSGSTHPSQVTAKSPEKATTLQPLGKSLDGTTKLLLSPIGWQKKDVISSNHSDDNSSAYQGLTEDDETMNAAAANDNQLTARTSGPDNDVGREETRESEHQPSDSSSPKDTMNAEGKGDESQRLDELQKSTKEDDVFKPTEENEGTDPSSRQEQPLAEKVAGKNSTSTEANASGEDQIDESGAVAASDEDQGDKETMDIDHATALEPSSKQQQGESPLKSTAHLENEDDYDKEDDDDEHVEGTGDTIVTTASGTSGGWSLYEGDTQMLPTGPSQIDYAGSLTNHLDADARLQDSGVDVQSDDEQVKLKEGSTGADVSEVMGSEPATKESIDGDKDECVVENELPSGRKEAVESIANEQAPAKNVADDNEEGEQLLDKPTTDMEHKEAPTEGYADDNKKQCIIDEDGGQEADHENLLGAMKHTPDVGSLPISYPNDHLDSPLRKKKNTMPPAEEAPQGGKMEEDFDGDAETQMSQDLLAVSPAKSQPDRSEKVLDHNAKTVTTLDAKDPTARLDDGAQGARSRKNPSPVSKDHNPSIQKKSEDGREVNINKNASPGNGHKTSTKQKSPPKKSPLPRQKNSSDDETKWMSSSRHLHSKKQGNIANNSSDGDGGGSSSPRLLMPSFKPIRKNNSDEEPSAKKPTTLNDNAKDDDGGSDDNEPPWSVAGRGHNDDDVIDPIENTQEDEHTVTSMRQPSAFKRLSRGTSSSSRSPKKGRNDDSSLKFSPTQSTEMKAKSSGGGKSTSKVIKPKVLRYETVTKSNDDDASSSSSAASDSSSEAEFSDNDDETMNNNDDHLPPQSQTDQKIMKQLREVKAMASKLPTAQEMQDISTRKELSDEISELKKSHKTSMNKLKREKNKLMAQLKSAEDIIQQKDEIIEKKNSLLKEQFEVLAQITGKVVAGSSSATSKRTPHPATATTMSKKRKNKVEKTSEYDSDEEEDDEVPLSALKSKGAQANKKRRKAYGSRQGAKTTPAKNKVNDRGFFPKPKAEVSKAAAASSRSIGDASSSVDTSPISNRSSSSSAKKKKRKNNDTIGLSSEIWKELQEKGWKYQTGPEPHNKVYVPRDGATHVGTQLGIHFFDCDQVIDAAIERGDLVGNSSKKATETAPRVKKTSAPRVVAPAAQSSDQTNKKYSAPVVQYPGHKVIQNDTPSQTMDDSKLCGSSKLLTLESAQAFLNIVTSFMREDNHDRFMGSFFNPLWIRLKNQGSGGANDSGLNWRYDTLRDSLARRWCFVPPGNGLGSKGVVGKDYFVTETEVALVVLKEVGTVEEVSHLYAEHADLFSVILPVLTRAVDENLDYKDAKRGKSASVRTRRVKTTFQPDSSPKSSPKSAAKGGKSPQKKGGKQQPTSSKKRVSTKITPETKASSGTAKKKQKTKAAQQLEEDSTTSPSFHMSQTQGVEAMLPYNNRRSPGQNNGPLSGFSFFYSGINPNFMIDEKIKRLGGKVVPYNSFTIESAYKKAFFLADYTSWRKMKYIHAASLGCPMLHYQWIAELEEKFNEYGTAKAFDSDLYVRYRLPLGLDLAKGYFPLQRASNARSWDPPGCTKGDGNSIFNGMTVALAIDQTQESDWKMILTACGATVMTLSDVQKGKGKINVDCCLLASTSLPPHVVSLPPNVSKLMQFIGDGVPLLDLAWAHQSIIQRECLPLDGDDRYSVTLNHSMNSSCNVFSIKTKAGGIRYEVGDLVQFSRGTKTTSRGRIADIIRDRQGKCRLEIQLLDSNGGYELVDCPSSAKIVVDVSNLQGNVLMLDNKDFNRLGYLPKKLGQSNIFNRFVPSNESQL